jgi:hypothetical protein
MTKEQAKQLLENEAFKAFANGAKVELLLVDGKWHEARFIDAKAFLEDGIRIKPEPKLRAWTAAEVPMGALMGRKLSAYRAAIIEANSECIRFGSHGDAVYQEAMDTHEHSFDGGKTWLPCGTLE